MTEPLVVFGADPGAVTGWCALAIDGRRAVFLDGGTDRDVWVIAGILDACRPDLFALETVLSVYPRARFGPAMATAIKDTGTREGILLATANRLRVPTVSCTAAEWRKATVDSATADDARIKARLVPQIENFPGRSSNHLRDAAGVALFAARKARVDGMTRRRSA